MICNGKRAKKRNHPFARFPVILPHFEHPRSFSPFKKLKNTPLDITKSDLTLIVSILKMGTHISYNCLPLGCLHLRWSFLENQSTNPSITIFSDFLSAPT